MASVSVAQFGSLNQMWITMINARDTLLILIIANRKYTSYRCHLADCPEYCLYLIGLSEFYRTWCCSQCDQSAANIQLSASSLSRSVLCPWSCLLTGQKATFTYACIVEVSGVFHAWKIKIRCRCRHFFSQPISAQRTAWMNVMHVYKCKYLSEVTMCFQLTTKVAVICKQACHAYHNIPV